MCLIDSSIVAGGIVLIGLLSGSVMGVATSICFGFLTPQFADGSWNFGLAVGAAAGFGTSLVLLLLCRAANRIARNAVDFFGCYW